VAPTQSEVIETIERDLITNGWIIAFSCRPNRAHIGVVPISTSSIYGKQRYPDLVSTNGHVVRLTEVEPILTAEVLREIAARFSYHIQVLSDPPRYQQWAEAVRQRTGVSLPTVFVPVCELVVIRSSRATPRDQVQALPGGYNFEIIDARQFAQD
jgi:hypothetical protein